eukprot:5119065-Pyramimonas_sp.AAC.1
MSRGSCFEKQNLLCPKDVPMSQVSSYGRGTKTNQRFILYVKPFWSSNIMPCASFAAERHSIVRWLIVFRMA